jgi:hypothetical protein
MIGDTEMIDYVRDVEKYMKEVSTGRATCKNCLLKIKLLKYNPIVYTKSITRVSNVPRVITFNSLNY